MEKIKVLIVEDELLTAANLKIKLEDHGFNVINTVPSGEEALDIITAGTPDLLLMDIQLAGELDGISTAEKILELINVPIIYLSDHVDEMTVKRARSTHPANYLSKPFRANDLLRALELAFYNAKKDNPTQTKSKLTDRVFIRTDSQTSEMISYADILYLEADRAYSYVVTASKKYTLSKNMKKVFDQFESPDFLRVHRSYIVNINQITGLEGNIVKVGPDHEVQVSADFKRNLMNNINLIK